MARKTTVLLKGTMSGRRGGGLCLRGRGASDLDCTASSMEHNLMEIGNGDICARHVNFHNLVLRNSKYNRVDRYTMLNLE